MAIKLSPQVVLFQMNNQRLGKIKVRMLFTHESGVPLLIDYLKSNKNVIENLTIRDIKKERVEVNLKLLVRQKITLPEFYCSLKQLQHVHSVSLDH